MQPRRTSACQSTQAPVCLATRDFYFCVGSSMWASLVVQLVKKQPAMWETWVQSLGGEDPLEKEMASHSSILAWRIPWTEELGGLQFAGRKESDTTERLRFHFPVY